MKADVSSIRCYYLQYMYSIINVSATALHHTVCIKSRNSPNNKSFNTSKFSIFPLWNMYIACNYFWRCQLKWDCVCFSVRCSHLHPHPVCQVDFVFCRVYASWSLITQPNKFYFHKSAAHCFISRSLPFPVSSLHRPCAAALQIFYHLKHNTKEFVYGRACHFSAPIYLEVHLGAKGHLYYTVSGEQNRGVDGCKCI